MSDTIEVIIYKLIRRKPYYLLLKRKQVFGSFWQPVVGKIEPGEVQELAVYRECLEEIGLQRTSIIRLVPEFYKFTMNKHYLTGKPIKPKTEYVYAIQVKRDFEPDLSGNPDSEHEASIWLDYSKADSLLHWEDNKKALREFYVRRLYLTGNVQGTKTFKNHS